MPTTGVHLHGPKATRAAATSRMMSPGGTVGTSTPETIWITNPAAARRRAATVTLPFKDNAFRWSNALLLSES
jgi:hypothetical protein